MKRCLELKRVIGKGSFGTIYYGYLHGRNSAKVVAVKKMDAGQAHKVEVRILQQMNLKYIVQFEFCFKYGEYLFLGMELCKMDLFDKMKTTGMSLSEVKIYLTQVAIGLNELHNHSIIYGDLKPENILIGNDGHIRLCDFGLSHILKHPGEKIVRSQGTLHYTCPEVLKRQSCGVECDFWSFGVLLHELVFGILPWNLDEECENLQLICDKICYSDLERPRLLDTSPILEEGYDLIERLLQKDVSIRLCARNGYRDLCTHPFFVHINWKDPCKLATVRTEFWPH